ncbi:uncharacterized protein VK521_017698 isoform 1-T2 [Ammospiza maritima maritima]
MLRERQSECWEEIRIGGWCCVEPEVLRWEEPLGHGRWDRAWCCSSAAASAGLGSRRGRMIEVGLGPGLDRHRYRKMALPWSSHWFTAGNGKGRGIACGSPGTESASPLPQRRRPSRRAPPGGHDTAPQPCGDTEPPSRPGSTAATALPCESHSAHIPPLRVRIPGGSPPNERGWGRCSRCGCARCGPGGEQKPPKGWQPLRPWDLREELCLQRAEHTSRCGHRGTGTALAQTRLKRCLWPLSLGLL